MVNQFYASGEDAADAMLERLDCDKEEMIMLCTAIACNAIGGPEPLSTQLTMNELFLLRECVAAAATRLPVYWSLSSLDDKLNRMMTELGNQG